jgi:hypothetical protein
MRKSTQFLPSPAMTSHVHMVMGTQSVLEYQSLLQELAQRFGQPAAMHGVEHFLTGAGRNMTPYLVFVLAEKRRCAPLAIDNILGAALLYEFRVLGMSSGIFVTEGKDGMRSVIAPATWRAFVAAAVSTALLDYAAQIIVASYIDTPHFDTADADEPLPLPRRSFHWAAVTRPAPGYLPLRGTLDQTIDLFNKRTRRNFRYYRRLLEAVTPLEFVPEADAALSLAELQALNRDSLEPVSDELMRLRHQSFAGQPGAFLCGLRTRAGQWLALIGGWRDHGTTVLQWQLNSRGYERFSLVTVARSFWMEFEIALGTQVLRIDGGTTHAMNHSFIPENAVDLILHRSSLLAFAVVKVLAPFVAGRKISRIKNSFLAETLTRPGLRWHTLPPAATGEAQPEPRYATNAITAVR